MVLEVFINRETWQ